MERQPASMLWRCIVQLLFACVTAATSPAASAAFDFEDVAREAKALAAESYRPPPPLSALLAGLDYDQIRRIRFDRNRSLWRDLRLPFQLQFLPAVGNNRQTLRLFEVVDGRPQPLVIGAQAFDADGQLPAGTAIGVAGLRVLHPLNDPAKLDELIAFAGASYFRALGVGQRYGLSARGLAVDTVAATAEEFPAFTAFWIERPAPGAATLTLYALLDGPRVTGAYRFVVSPGVRTRVDVRARVWTRAAAATLGFAPLSSMFLTGENQPRADDYRPEVHDSDGLQLQSGDGEWLWRPLLNPASGRFVTSFAMHSPRGFGLMQRDRSLASYEDLEAVYEKRPSVWVEPIGDWGAGRVELLQFATPDETHDNIAAYWVPARPVPPGAAVDLAWRLEWCGDDAPAPPGARVLQTRRGHGYHRDAVPASALQFQIDFIGGELAGLAADAKVEAVASGNANTGTLVARAQPNPARGGWRVTLAVTRIDLHRPLELRAFLRLGSRTLSETWSYALPAE